MEAEVEALTHKLKHTRTYPPTHTHAHTHAHTYIHTYIHTYTHTHPLPHPLSYTPPPHTHTHPHQAKAGGAICFGNGCGCQQLALTNGFIYALSKGDEVRKAGYEGRVMRALMDDFAKGGTKGAGGEGDGDDDSAISVEIYNSDDEGAGLHHIVGYYSY